MYHLIGDDGLEYGPIPPETVRQWIRDGRLNARSRARLASESVWRQLGDIPDFAPSFPAAGSAGGQAGPGPGTAPSAAAGVEHWVARAAERAGRLSATDAFGKAWATLTGDFWPIVGVGALSIVIDILIGGTGVGLLLTGVFLGGTSLFALHHVRGRPAGVGDLFAGFSGEAFPSLVVAGLLYVVFAALGAALCILPGLYVLAVYPLSFALAVDKKLGFWDAMEVSRRVAQQQFGCFAALFLLAVLAKLAGALALGLGVFVAYPLVFLAYAYKYESLFGE